MCPVNSEQVLVSAGWDIVFGSGQKSRGKGPVDVRRRGAWRMQSRNVLTQRVDLVDEERRQVTGDVKRRRPIDDTTTNGGAERSTVDSY